MSVIKITRDDLSEMIHRVIRSMLNETVDEVMGSIVAAKEDVIRQIIKHIERVWEYIKKENVEPDRTATFGVFGSNDNGGMVFIYEFDAPNELTDKLGAAENFVLHITIKNYLFDDKSLTRYFGSSDRETEGVTYISKSEKFDRFKEIPMDRKIDLTIPAVDGELQVNGIYSTLYHELNHCFSHTQTKIKKSSHLDNDELERVNLMSLTRRDENPHFTTQRELNPSRERKMLQKMTYGEYSTEYRALNYLFYGLWETTERNARAESIYGDLSAMKSTRESFARNNEYKSTSAYEQIELFKELLGMLKDVPVDNPMWTYAARMMNMNPRGKNKIFEYDSHERKFLEAVKKRFITRSEELIKILYKKSMKVAELYFQRQEEKPGGGLDRLSQILTTN